MQHSYHVSLTTNHTHTHRHITLETFYKNCMIDKLKKQYVCVCNIACLFPTRIQFLLNWSVAYVCLFEHSISFNILSLQGCSPVTLAESSEWHKSMYTYEKSKKLLLATCVDWLKKLCQQLIRYQHTELQLLLLLLYAPFGQKLKLYIYGNFTPIRVGTLSIKNWSSS